MDSDELRIGLGPFSLGVVMDDDPLSKRLESFYRDFLTIQEPVIKIEVTVGKGEAEMPTVPKVSPQRVEFDAEGYRGVIDWQKKNASLHLRVANPLIGIDYFLRVTAAVAAFDIGGMMIHAAGVEREGKAYLFLGYSGAGKTTTARNSPAGSVLNDDLLVIYPLESSWYAASTPFYNPTQHRPRPGCAPITKVLYLVKDKTVYLEPASHAQALAEMVSCVPILSVEPYYLREFLQRCQKILGCVSYYRLHLLPDDSYWARLLQE